MPVVDPLRGRPGPRWHRTAVGYAWLDEGADGLRFVLHGARSDGLSDAQIDDYAGLARSALPWRPPLTLRLRARFSAPAERLLGTAGFGFWNNPGDPGLGFGAPPNWLWFACYSPPSRIALGRGSPGRGWLASSMNAGSADPLTMALGGLVMRVPVVSRLALRLARGRLALAARSVPGDPTAWHDYAIEWRPEAARFAVDGEVVCRVANPPRLPLGFVAWMDNNWAALAPDGAYRSGRLAVPHAQWLQVADLRIEEGIGGA